MIGSLILMTGHVFLGPIREDVNSVFDLGSHDITVPRVSKAWLSLTGVPARMRGYVDERGRKMRSGKENHVRVG